MDKVKCECGHVNPHGTIICESCGKPLEEEAVDQPKTLINMRYEGSARRSQTYSRTIVDKVWNFFSSVKVGVWLIVITLVSSAIGTIFPQEMYIPPTVTPAQYYEEQYGFLGKWYYELGFHNLYGSWWYMILIASIGISLVIASLDRVIPLYRSLKKQGVTRHPHFMKRQRVFGVTKIDSIDKTYDKMKEDLKKKRYNIREENGNLLAEKGRFSRWGPYVNHIGLIIFLFGAMLRFIPGMYVDDVLWIREGETRVIPGTEGNYFLKNESFIFEVYDKNDDEKFEEALTRVGEGNIAKNYQTNVVLYERVDDMLPGKEPELNVVKEHEIRVNEPLKHDHYALYQVDYKLNEFQSMSFNLVNKESGKAYGNLTVNLREPKSVYELGNGYRVELMSYFPDFYFDDNGPNTKSKIPNNPAFIFKMFSPEAPEGEISFVAIRQNIEPSGENEYKMAFAGIETVNVSALTVRRDFTLWVIAVGGAIFMVGVIQGMYWTHRRIWVQKHDDELWIAAHTNKNWYGVKKDIDFIIDKTNVLAPIDQLEEKEKNQFS